MSENFFFFSTIVHGAKSFFSFTNLTYRRLLGSQLIQPCAAPSSGAQYPPTVLGKAAPSSPFVVNPSPGPLLPLMTFRTNAEAVTMGEWKPLSEREFYFLFFLNHLVKSEQLYIVTVCHEGCCTVCTAAGLGSFFLLLLLCSKPLTSWPRSLRLD